MTQPPAHKSLPETSLRRELQAIAVLYAAISVLPILIGMLFG